MNNVFWILISFWPVPQHGLDAFPLSFKSQAGCEQVQRILEQGNKEETVKMMFKCAEIKVDNNE